MNCKLPHIIVPRIAAMAACVALFAVSQSVDAHEVQHKISDVQAVAVQLIYSDGEPFSYETYELYAGDGGTPVQTGRTDAAGYVVFVPAATGRYRLRAFSADGHGVDLTLPERRTGAAARTATAVEEEASGLAGVSRNMRLLLGLLVILAIFAGAQGFIRRKKTNSTEARRH